MRQTPRPAPVRTPITPERARIISLQKFLIERNRRPRILIGDPAEMPPPKECPDTLDHTAGTMLNECLAKYYHRCIRKIVPLFEPDYFIAGKAWDRALHAWEHSPGSEADRLAKAIEEIRLTYSLAKYRTLSEKRTPENLIELLHRYIERFAGHRYSVIASNVAFRLPYKDFWIGGEIDQYVDWPELAVVIGESKTTASQITDRYIAGFYLGSYAWQLHGYNWAVRQITTDVWGNYVTIACLDIPKRKTTARVLFQRLMIQPTNSQLEDHLIRFEHRMAKLRSAFRKDEFPKEGPHCSGGWGFHACEYITLCRQPGRVQEAQWSPLEFREAVWEPWYKRKGDWEELDQDARTQLEQFTSRVSQSEEIIYE